MLVVHEFFESFTELGGMGAGLAFGYGLAVDGGDGEDLGGGAGEEDLVGV